MQFIGERLLCWMKQKSIPTLILFSLLFLQAATYAQGNIKGTIIDSTGKSLANVSVTLLKVKDSPLVKGVISVDGGKYEFNNISSGQYFINANLLGYKSNNSKRFNIDSIHTKISLPAIKLISSLTTLAEVTVTVNRQHKVD